MPRTDILDYYVSLRRSAPGGKFRTALLAGPFATHTEALSMVKAAKNDASRLDAWTDFDAFGTMSLPRNIANPVGKLNERLGVVPRAIAAPPLPY
jgi:hypothetical protein